MLESASSQNEDEQNEAAGYISMMCEMINRNRFDMYFGKEKETIYDLNAGDTLVAFYRALGPMFRDEVRDKSFSGLRVWIGFAFDRGNRYIAETKMPYKSRAHAVESVHSLLKDPEFKSWQTSKNHDVPSREDSAASGNDTFPR